MVTVTVVFRVERFFHFLITIGMVEFLGRFPVKNRIAIFNLVITKEVNSSNKTPVAVVPLMWQSMILPFSYAIRNLHAFLQTYRARYNPDRIPCFAIRILRHYERRYLMYMRNRPPVSIQREYLPPVIHSIFHRVSDLPFRQSYPSPYPVQADR